MKKKISLVLLLITCVMVTTCINPAPAKAMTVHDPINCIQLILQYVEQLQQYSKEAEQVQNSLKQLENEARNLANMGGDQFSNMVNIQQDLQDTIALYEEVKGISFDYNESQSEWDSIYKDFGAYNGMKGTDYSQQVWSMMDQTSNAIYDAMKAQGLVAQIGDDHQNLQTLLNASSTAEGALAAAQAGNQILGVICDQLFRMQTIMAESYRAQLSYQNQVLQQQAASDVSNAMKVTPQNTNPKGKGYGKWDEN